MLTLWLTRRQELFLFDYGLLLKLKFKGADHCILEDRSKDLARAEEEFKLLSELQTTLLILSALLVDLLKIAQDC